MLPLMLAADAIFAISRYAMIFIIFIFSFSLPFSPLMHCHYFMPHFDIVDAMMMLADAVFRHAPCRHATALPPLRHRCCSLLSPPFAPRRLLFHAPHAAITRHYYAAAIFAIAIIRPPLSPAAADARR
jgi:hypothetical protein